MVGFLRGYRWLLVRLCWVELLLAAFLVLSMILAITAEVFFRYVLESSLFWVEEGSIIAFIWITFLGAAAAAKANRHIVIASYSDSLPPILAGWLAALASGIVASVAIIIAAYAWGYVDLQARTTTVSLPVDIPRSWMYSWPLFFAMSSIFLTYSYYLMDNVVHMLAVSVGAGEGRFRQAPIVELSI